MKIEAVIFDLDGVITKTALVHSAAWKRMFDGFLEQHAARTETEFRQFDHERDYLPYVDGKPRYKGVESFLSSRDIKLPYGDPGDDPGEETVCGLGNRKNQAFNEVLEKKGVDVYDSTVDLIMQLKSKGVRVGVASSSKNCKAVLERAGLLDLFETRVDGVVSAEIGLKGKPEPDIFTVAADELGAYYDRSVVVEDAVSGVQAGAKGNFGLVIGLARENNHHELKVNGADIVVSDLSEISYDSLVNWFVKGLEEDSWCISYHDYIPAKEKSRETLLAVGNGYIGTRGHMAEAKAGEFNYPGTYMAGLYNRLTSRVGDRDIENEDFVNCPDWIHAGFAIGEGSWLDINKVDILSIERHLSFKNGLFKRVAIVRDADGRETKIDTERFLSMKDPHLGGQRYTVTPLNYSGKIRLRTEIDGAIINDGVARYRQLNQKHLVKVSQGSDKGSSFVEVKTTGSDIHVAIAARNDYRLDGLSIEITPERISGDGVEALEIIHEIKQGQSLTIEKIMSIFSNQSWDSDNPLEQARSSVEAVSYEKVLSESRDAWDRIWDQIDMVVEGDRLAQKLLRLHLYHLMVSFSPNNRFIDASITARGLHGEAYRGHIFWDELFILPLYNVHFPEVAKAALLYRYNRLDAARRYAEEHGYKGAMFPWQSGSDGREETQVVHLNPLTGKWGPDFSSLQRHVSLAIAYNTWLYVHMTNDTGFLARYGMEMFLDICRFWASMAEFDPETKRYSIRNVMGPDEFHEKNPGAEKGGLTDNAYTNIMVVWSYGKAFDLLEKLTTEERSQVLGKLHIGKDELEGWKEIGSHLRIIKKDEILAQYDGYLDLKELDWDHYRNKYGNIYRMDRLLKAEGKSADDYKVAKQADTLQTFYNLDERTVTGILKELGYEPSEDYLSQNLNYYLARTSHGSTLSRVVHAQLANMIEESKLSWELYSSALTSDYDDIQGGTTGEGIHAGVMAGTVLIAMQSFAGVDLRGETVSVNPMMPEHWRRLEFRFDFKQVEYQLKVSQDRVEIMQKNDRGKEAEVEVSGRKLLLKPGEIKTVEYKQ